jgi:uncharacterized protein (TIGR04255 family)
MSAILSRPEGLPDFTDPPLTEVVLSVQFATPPQYSEAYVREIWALFENDFPKVQEMPAIPPAFEVFGGPELPGIRFGMMGGAMRNRYWFLNASGDELIQFQQDRFMHNWRKMAGKKNEYPRFESILAKYSRELESLERYFKSKSWGPNVVPNQCEITYVNQMPLQDDTGQSIPKSFYFKKIDLSLDEDVSDLNLNLRKTITKDGKPIGRLFVDCATGVDSTGQPVLGLNLTARGAPQQPSRSSSVEFLQNARVLIDTTFVSFTSEAAHKKWGRTQ